MWCLMSRLQYEKDFFSGIPDYLMNKRATPDKGLTKN